MRITKNQLRQIIKEELAGVLREEDPVDTVHTPRQWPSSDEGFHLERNPRTLRAQDVMTVSGDNSIGVNSMSDDEFVAEYGSTREEMGPDAVSGREAYLKANPQQIAPAPSDIRVDESRRRRKVRRTRKK
jgi:hypothetical protein